MPGGVSAINRMRRADSGQVSCAMDDPHGTGIVLYDFLHCRGGAEQVTLVLARGLPDADLCFGYRDPEHFPDEALRGLRCFDLGVRVQFPGARTLAGVWAYRRRTGFLSHYAWAIYAGSVAPEAVYNHRTGLNIYYCHTVPRFAYDLRSYYEKTGPLRQRLGTRIIGPWIRRRYPRALRRMDVIIANSENVRRRLADFVGVAAQVIHPPCDVDGNRWMGQGDYYLSTARLEPLKRVELVVEAFRRMPDLRLIVASGGGEEERLRALAADAGNIEITGWLDHTQLSALVGHCIATIYIPRDEDFGMSPVESLAAGKPVIGVAEGGLLETVVDGQSGRLIAAGPTVADVIAAVRGMSPDRAAAMRESCEQRASAFSEQQFLRKIGQVISSRVQVRAGAPSDG